MSAEQQSDFDADFDAAVEGWRNRYKLREDDAVFLLIDLFRIHQRHWDELRRRDQPSVDQFHSDILKFAESAKAIQNEASALVKTFQTAKDSGTSGVSAATAFVAATCALAAGYFLGRLFP